MRMPENISPRPLQEIRPRDRRAPHRFSLSALCGIFCLKAAEDVRTVSNIYLNQFFSGWYLEECCPVEVMYDAGV
jgi:hypothetical protein